MKVYLVQENGENVATIPLTEGMAGCWPITAVSDYVEAQGSGRYDELSGDDYTDYVLASTDDFCETVFCNGYLTASVIGVSA